MPDLDDHDPLAAYPSFTPPREVILPLQRMARHSSFSREYLQRRGVPGIAVDIEVARQADAMLVKLVAQILGHREPPHHVPALVTVPRWASPWQHLKARWADRWWFAWVVRRWPVRYVDETIHATATLQASTLYPHTHIDIPELGASVVYHEPPEVNDPWGTGGITA